LNESSSNSQYGNANETLTTAKFEPIL
jgi:hypothetical protein